MQNAELTLKSLKNLIDLENFDKSILSNPLKKDESLPKKVKIKKFVSKNKVLFQFEYFVDQKVLHKSFEKDFVLSEILRLMTENFKQCEISSKNCSLTILMNKDKNFKITGVKKHLTEKTRKTQNFGHNKEKNYILKDGVFTHFLYHLGIMNKNGKVLNNKQKKFKQINKFLETLQTIEKYLPQNAVIIDIGCGKSYLTFAIYHYFNNIKQKNVKIKGFDLKKDVVQNCNEIAKKLNFKNLEFFCEDARNLKHHDEQIHMLITLHACDTATDHALYHGIKHNCKIIMSVPCCQHELFGQIKNEQISAVLSYGIFKERFSAILTDTLRAEALKLFGYKTSVMEFIDMEHTPKNIMIRAVKKDTFTLEDTQIQNYKNLMQNFDVNPKIYELVKDLIR